MNIDYIHVLFYNKHENMINMKAQKSIFATGFFENNNI